MQRDNDAAALGCVSISYVDAGLISRELYPNKGLTRDLAADLALPDDRRNAAVRQDARIRNDTLKAARGSGSPTMSSSPA